MSNSPSRILVTGASGQLGRLVIEALLKQVPAEQIVAGARNLQALDGLAARGVTVRRVDYGQPETLHAALKDVDRVLLVSSSEVGQRVAQHRNVIEAAQQAGVKLLAYTSVLHADTSALLLANEHRSTEALLRDSGLPYVLLRNGWYTENYTGAVAPALQSGVVLGSAGSGRIASATRADYAEAAAAVLVSSETQAGRIYELAGDSAYTLDELAAEIAKQSGKPVSYRDLPQVEYQAALVQAGLPEAVAGIIAQSDRSAADGALFDDRHQLSQLIGRATTPLRDTVAAALAAASKTQG